MNHTVNRASFILVSPGPIDGYPPVQNQARLLAAAGHAVEVITSPISAEKQVPDFACPGVRVSCLSAAQSYRGRMRRHSAFSAALLGARLRAGRSAIEIAYDPIGMFYSDMVPLRPRTRVAHFHELLQYPQHFLEKRLQRAIGGYQLVVVPDEDRAVHTMKALSLHEPPLVIENYPLRAGSPPGKGPRSGPFEVVYCGSLGLNQKLDMAIRSCAMWPAETRLLLIGNADTQTGQLLKELAVSFGVQERVVFTGWMESQAAERRMAEADLGLGLLDMSSEQLRTALGASNKRYQYMKAGLPQIGDLNPGIQELLEGSRIGTCLRSHDPQELGAVVSGYVLDPLRGLAEGARAFGLHQDRYNYESVFTRLIERLDAFA